MKFKKVLVVTDNHYLLRQFKNIVIVNDLAETEFNYCCTSPNMALPEEGLLPFNIKKRYKELIGVYDLIFSLHCKQIFPRELVKAVTCINVHPGYNPYNRGWYPQVFSIINKLPIGATIHIMDEKVDHGSIIVQREVLIDSWDTSLEVYNKVLDVEIELLKENLVRLINKDFVSVPMSTEGNYNSIADFDKLTQLDLNNIATLQEHINILRALTHGNFMNAHFIDDKTGKKVFITVNLKISE